MSVILNFVVFRRQLIMQMKFVQSKAYRVLIQNTCFMVYFKLTSYVAVIERIVYLLFKYMCSSHTEISFHLAKGLNDSVHFLSR